MKEVVWGMAAKAIERHERDSLTTGQIAAVTGVSVRTVTKWIDAGHLSGWRSPGSRERHVYKDVLVDFLNAIGHYRAAERVLAGSGLLHSVVCPTVPGRFGAVVNVMVLAMDKTIWERLVRHLDGQPVCTYFAHHVLEAGFFYARYAPRIVVVDFSIGRPDVHLTASWFIQQPQRPVLCGLMPEDYGTVADGPFKELGFAMLFRKPFDVAELGAWLLEQKPLHAIKRSVSKQKH